VRELLLSTPTGKSRIIIGNCEKELRSACKDALLVVVDKKVLERDRRGIFNQENIFPVDSGENIKSLAAAENIYAELYKRGATRSASVLGVGGGTITDLLGFVTATYLRGLEFISAPTSLLAQVDASVGGKNGVNFSGAKNLIGTTRQASVCICDHGFLETLTPELVSEGYSEIVKHALLAPSPLLKLLREKTVPLALEGLDEIIFETVKEKKRIVEIDELETGERRKLNLGHTIGHGLEASLRIPHGHSVSIGTVLEANISLSRKLISESQLEEIKTLFAKFLLPVSIKFDPSKVKSFMSKDKKKYGTMFKMPLLTGLGCSELFDVPQEELFEALDKFA